MNGYDELEQLLLGKDVCILIMTNGESLDDGHVDIEIFDGREPEPKRSVVQCLNALSAEEGLRKAIRDLKEKNEKGKHPVANRTP